MALDGASCRLALDVLDVGHLVDLVGRRPDRFGFDHDFGTISLAAPARARVPAGPTGRPGRPGASAGYPSCRARRGDGAGWSPPEPDGHAKQHDGKGDEHRHDAVHGPGR